jgi:hypothetical protein
VKKVLFILLSITASSSLSFANLLVNGDFETVDGRIGLTNGRALNALNPNQWDVFNSLPGLPLGPDSWTRLDGRGIEVQANVTVSGILAHSGSHYIELDSHPNQTNPGSTNSTMGQSFNFNTGFYTLTFWYRPRTNEVADNGIQVRLGNTVLRNVDSTTGQSNSWVQYSNNFFVAAAGAQNIIFQATGNANQLGGFVDTVSLTRDRNQDTGDAVPEPSTLALIGGSLVALAARRKFKA